MHGMLSPCFSFSFIVPFVVILLLAASVVERYGLNLYGDAMLRCTLLSFFFFLSKRFLPIAIHISYYYKTMRENERRFIFSNALCVLRSADLANILLYFFFFSLNFSLDYTEALKGSISIL